MDAGAVDSFFRKLTGTKSTTRVSPQGRKGEGNLQQAFHREVRGLRGRHEGLVKVHELHRRDWLVGGVSLHFGME